MDGTREEYPSDPKVSRRLWRQAALALWITLAAIVIAVIAILAQPDARRADPIWAEGFDSVLVGWSVEPADTVKVEDSTLRLEPPVSDSFALAMRALSIRNFVVETRARAIGSTDNGYGIVVGSAEEHIAFLISSDGYFSTLQEAQGRWIDVQPWKPWPHVRRGDAVNTLRVECRDEACAFFVNEEFTTRAEMRGERTRIGLMVWRYAAEASVAFDDLRLWPLPNP